MIRGGADMPYDARIRASLSGRLDLGCRAAADAAARLLGADGKGVARTGPTSLSVATRDGLAEAVDELEDHGFVVRFPRSERMAWIATLEAGPYAALLHRGERPLRPSGWASDPGDMGSGRYLSTCPETAARYGTVSSRRVSHARAAFVDGRAEAATANLLYRTCRGADRAGGADTMRADFLAAGLTAMVIDRYDSPPGHMTVVEYDVPLPRPSRAWEEMPDEWPGGRIGAGREAGMAGNADGVAEGPAGVPFATEGDRRVAPALARRLGEVRGGMVAAAEAHPLPPGLSARPTGHPRVEIAHPSTGRSVEVGLYAYGAVRKALGELFPDGFSPTHGGGDRFAVDATGGGSSVRVVDRMTGRSCKAPLFALRDIRAGLAVLVDGRPARGPREAAGPVEVEGGTLEPAPFPSAGQPAFRILDADGTEVGWVRRDGADDWAVVDVDARADGEERIPYARCGTFDEACRHVEGGLASLAQDGPRGP